MCNSVVLDYRSIINSLKIPDMYKDGIIKMAQKVIEKYPDVTSIVLFGSCAREEVLDKCSDIDICVILDTKHEDRLSTEIYLESGILDEVIDFSQDFIDIIDRNTLVFTPSEFKDALSYPITMTKCIEAEGVVLYGKKDIL